MEVAIIDNTHTVTEKTGAFDYSIPTERPLYIFINNGYYAAVMLSPGNEREFIFGHLYSEGIIRSLQEIVSTEIEGNMVEIVLKRKMLSFPGKVILSGCGGGSTEMRKGRLPQITTEAVFTRDTVSAGIRDVLNSEMYRRTRGVHKCSLLNASSVIASAEDIGRHNALDKVIGEALIAGYDFHNACAAVTGRVSSEMVLKCSRANIPVIASKTSVTSFAIELAHLTGLTVIGFVTGSRMKIYTHSSRIAGECFRG